jgi:Reverse transcriptase (RNA-dependent DNA polymerase)/Integrase core domain
VEELLWEPIDIQATIDELDKVRTYDGWRMISGVPALIIHNARALRGCEPRHPAEEFCLRSTVGFFPDYVHPKGNWWLLEGAVEFMSRERAHLKNARIPYPVPVLVLIFSRRDGSPPDLKDTPSSPPTAGGDASNAAPRPRRVEIVEPIEHGQEEPEVPMVDAAAENHPAEPLGEDGGPEWSSWDLGRCMRGLRHENMMIRSQVLRKLHIKWWHASTEKMRRLLETAGVESATLKLISAVVDTCKICRQWKRPGHKAVATTRMTSNFNQLVQIDLLFIGDLTILHALDEATRWTVTSLLPSKDAKTITRAFTEAWIRVFGAPEVIMTDHESAMCSDEASVWCEKWNISLRMTPKGSHAHIVERHHQIMRDLIHKIKSQAETDGIDFRDSDIVAEATYVKNAMVTINKVTPYQAVLGRHPPLMRDLEGSGTAEDQVGAQTGVSRHTMRLRELAIAAISEATAKARLARSESTNARLTAQQLDLQVGDAVDIWRDPPNKDLTGWRGPCTVVSTLGVDQGHVDVQWQGRVMSAAIGQVRRHIFLEMVAASRVLECPQMEYIRQFLKTQDSCALTFAFVRDHLNNTWQLSQAAVTHPQMFRAVLYTAATVFRLMKCVGARVGRGAHVLPAVSGIEKAALCWWPINVPELYHIVEHKPQDKVSLRKVFSDSTGTEDDHLNICWIQYLATTSQQSRVLRKRCPEELQLAPDPDGDEHTRPQQPTNIPIDTMTTRRDSMATSQPMSTTRTSMSTTPISPPAPPPPNPPAPPPSPRSRPSKRPAPSTTSSQHTVPQPTSTTSSSNATRYYPPQPPPSTQPSSPTPVATSESLPSTVEYISDAEDEEAQFAAHYKRNGAPELMSEVVEVDGESLFISPAAQPSSMSEHDPAELELSFDQCCFLAECPIIKPGQILVMSFTAGQTKAVIERDVDELTAAELKANWPLVEAAVRKEIRSFFDLKTFIRAAKSAVPNLLTSKWVFRWKRDASGQKQVKARLTVRGFQDMASDTLETYAGTSSRWGQRLVCSIAAQHQWHLQSADISTAFLQGLTFEQLSKETGEPLRNVAFVPPAGYGRYFSELPGLSDLDWSREVLKMVKPIYGLKDAPRAWRKRLDIALRAAGGVPMITDQAIYLFFDRLSNGSETLSMILSTHVDDLKIAGREEVVEALLKTLTKQFGDLKLVKNKFEHCGVMHEQELPSMSIVMHQNHYALGLKPIVCDVMDVTDQARMAQLITPELHAQYLSLLGGLSWLLQTRPDVAIFIQALQRHSKKPSYNDLLKLNRVCKWVKRRPMHLKYERLEGPVKILVISDSAFRREDESGLAMRGALVCIAEDQPGNPGGRIHILEFYSRKQKRVTRSTFAAELHALADSLEVGKLICYSLCEIMRPRIKVTDLLSTAETDRLIVRIVACIDAKSVFDSLAAADLRVPSEASLIMVLLQIKEMLKQRFLRELYWISTQDMLADGLNKGAISRDALMTASRNGVWRLTFPLQCHSEPYTPEKAQDILESTVDEFLRTRSK